MKKIISILSLAALTTLAGCATPSGGKKADNTEADDTGGGKTPTGGGNTSGGQTVARAENVPAINAKAQRLFEDANKAYSACKGGAKCDWDNVRSKYAQAYDADGHLAEAVYNQGVIAARQGKKEEAAELYERARNIKP